MSEPKPSHKKDGEKALLLHACGELLFGCTGETKVTQGIYLPNKKKFECFCKRAVWVPKDLSLDTLRLRFGQFGVALPSSISDDCVVGLCGKNPTRTAHATDCAFMLLSQSSRSKFVPVAVISVDHNQIDEYTKPIVSLRMISAGEAAVNECIDWIRKESRDHDKEKCKKRPKERRDRSFPISDPRYSTEESSRRLFSAYPVDQHRVFDDPYVLHALKRRHVEATSFPVPEAETMMSNDLFLPQVDMDTFRFDPQFDTQALNPSFGIGFGIPPQSPEAQLFSFDFHSINESSESVSSPENTATPVVSATAAGSPNHVELDFPSDLSLNNMNIFS